MVLQEPIDPPYSKEFVLRKNNLRDLKALEDRVKQLFSAEFQVFIPRTGDVEDSSIEDHPADLENYDSSLQWIRVISEEHPELLDGAKVFYLKPFY